jgi:hypothetical protein
MHLFERTRVTITTWDIYKNDEVLEVIQGSHDQFYNALLEDEVLIITKSDIIKLNDRQTMYWRNVVK